MGRTTGSLSLAIVLLIVSVGVGIYTGLRSSEINRQRVAIDSRLSRVQMLNEAINGTLSTALLERNILRAAQYDALNEELSATLADVRALSRRLRLAPEAVRLQQETEKLKAIQNRAYAFMLSDNWPAASDTLSEENYLRDRKIYEISSDLAIVALTSELAQMERVHERQRLGALWLILVAVVLLLWVGKRHSERLHHEAAQQARLREAVARANQELEHKVQQRTAELKEANLRLERLSSLDGLSGLSNRRIFDETLLAEWQRAQRHGHWLALIMLDIDHFKAYNDNYGHQAGDACIQALAGVLSRSLRRAGELVARYGGEEFVFILPGSDPDAASREAERIRQAVEALALPHAHSTTAPVVTVSLGVAATIPGADQSTDALLKAADDALYRAKRAGRNQVVCADFQLALPAPDSAQAAPSHT
ncbi:MAG: diguanylate cyclase [Alcaligenaceae bacterium]|nr:diguanylate cyclase [Alcaligenaceae bacterium]